MNLDLCALLRDPNAVPSPAEPIVGTFRSRTAGPSRAKGPEDEEASRRPIPATAFYASGTAATRVNGAVAKPGSTYAAKSASNEDKRSLMFKNNARRDETSKRDQRKAIAMEEKKWKRAEMLEKRRPGLEEAKKETSPGLKATGKARIRAGPELHRRGKEAVVERLRRFKEERSRKKEEEKKKKKQPFKVGVYKLENSAPDRFTPMSKIAPNSGIKRKLEPAKGHSSTQQLHKMGQQKKPRAAKALKMETITGINGPVTKGGDSSKNKPLHLSTGESEVVSLRRSTRLATKPTTLPAIIEINRLDTVAEEEAAKADSPDYLDTVDTDSTSAEKLNDVHNFRRSTRFATLGSTEEEDENCSPARLDVVDDTFGSVPPTTLKTPLKPTASNTLLTPALEALNLHNEERQGKSTTRRSRRVSKANPPAHSSTSSSEDVPKTPRRSRRLSKANPPVLTSTSSAEDMPVSPKQSLMSPKISFNFLPASEQKNFQFTARPRLEQSFDDASVFKTPTSTARRKRLSEFPRLLDPLRADIDFQRGSTSERRRRRKGQNPFDMVHNFGLDDVPDDPNSPVHVQLAELFKQRKQIEIEGANVEETDLFQKVEIILSAEKKRLSTGSARNFGEELQAMEMSENPDVSYFRRLLATESARLSSLGAAWETKLASASNDGNADSIPEESQGQVRAVIGKSKLLLNKKGRFSQFGELIDNCEFRRGDKVTTVTDLQGFWEMIFAQVKDIQEAFEGLDRLEANRWIPIIEAPVEQENKKPKAKKRPLPKKNTPAKASSSLREMMAAKRRELQSTVPGGMSPQVQAVKDEEKEFDGKFFKVRSPLRKVAATNSARKGLTASSKLNFAE